MRGRAADMMRCGVTLSLLIATLIAAGTGRAAAAVVTVQVGPSDADAFVPQNAQINPGDTVQWIWSPGDVHSVTAGSFPPTGNGTFDSGLQSAPFTFSETFNHPGVYHYFCLEHYLTGMVGTVTVIGADPAPTALFASSTTSPTVGQQVTFDATSSSTTDGDRFESYKWDFGDGSVPQVTLGPTIVHAFAQAGTATVTLTTTDAGSASSAPVTHQLTVQPPPDTPPTARFTFQAGSLSTAQAISFDASTSTDGDGDTITGYRWVFGDGASQATTTPTVTHRYVTGGRFVAQLIVLDSRGTPSVPASVAVTITAPWSRPRVSALKLAANRFCTRMTHKCRHPGTRLQFSLSEPASVVVTVTGRHGGRTLTRSKVAGKLGKNSLALRGAGLRPGRYVVTVTATSRGLRGNPSRATFTVVTSRPRM